MDAATALLLQEAVALHRRGALADAADRYAQVLRNDPSNADVLYYLAQLSCQQGRLMEGINFARRTLAIDPKQGRAHLLLGMALVQLDRAQEALASLDAAIACQPQLADAYGNRGDVLVELGRLAEAVESYDRALTIQPNAFENWCNRGAALQDLRRYEEAIASYDRAITLKPNNPDVLNNRANALARLGRNEQALTDFDRVLALRPDHAHALVARGNALRKLARHDEALWSYDRALAVKTDNADALMGRGCSLIELTRYSEALKAFEAILAIRPADVNALNNRGFTLNALDLREEALASYDLALRVDANNAEALNNRGVVLSDLGQHQEAIASYDRALAVAPNHAGALCNRAKALNTLNRYDEALVATERALAVEPRHADALVTRGNTLVKLQRHGEAIACFEGALAIDPKHAEATGVLAERYSAICDWDNAARIANDLNDCLADDKSLLPPFILFAFPVGPAQLLKCTKHFVAHAIPKVPLTSPDRAVRRSDKIRLAYLSADFCKHATAYLVAELFELHDRKRFEITGISYGIDDKTGVRARLVRSFDRFHDVSLQSDRDVAKLLRELDIDIAVDLKGLTENARPGILAARPAPIQVTYLGYPGTTGLNFIDYVIADRIVLPSDQQPFYTEKIVHLPDSYQVNDSKRQIGSPVPSRAELGLPEHALVFCCFNNSWKINRSMFDIWMRLLSALDDSVLWLYHSNALAVANLRKEAQARGVNPARLFFAPYMDVPEHLARLTRADLFLDTLPYNAHTTASDALWAGVPVVTCLGPTFAGRVAASLLEAVGLPELVTHDLGDYERLAGELAAQPALLRSIKQRLQENRLTCALFDSDRFRRHLEAAYTTMWETHQRGESPLGFTVEPI